MVRMMQAKDISTDEFLSAMYDTRNRWGSSMLWDVTAVLGMPEPVVRAKARRLIKADTIDGCACGCRGDFVPL